MFEALVLGQPVKFYRTKKLPRGCDGIYYPDKRIAKYKPQKNNDHEILVMLHEYYHAALCGLLADYNFDANQIEFMCDAFGRVSVDLIKNNPKIIDMVRG